MPLVCLYLGCLIGSFLAVLAERIPIKQNFIISRSRCTTCQHTLHWFDLIPFNNLIWQNNRCRYCQQKIPMYHSLFELICGISLTLFLMIYPQKFISTSTFSLILILLYLCLILSLTDYLYGIVEPKILYPVTFLLLIWAFYHHDTMTLHGYALICTTLFFMIIHYLLPNSLGGGDSKLLITLSLFLGLTLTLWIILFASLSGIIFILISNTLTHQNIKKIPFVPFITLGYVLTFLFIV